MMLCVMAVVLLSVSVVPVLLDRLTPGTPPGVRLSAWLAIVLTVLGAVLAVPVIAATGGHAVTAAVVAAPVVVLTYRIRHRYNDIMRGAGGHARAVRMIARPTNGVRSQTPVVTIDSPLPLVYCLAGPPSLVVTTTGAHTRLNSAELEAVLAHEEAHLRQRHAQLRAILQAIATTIWWLPFFDHAAKRITEATELCADRAAARRHHPDTLARALVALAPAPSIAVGAALTGATERLEHLLQQPQRHYGRQLAIALVVTTPAIEFLTLALGCPLF